MYSPHFCSNAGNVKRLLQIFRSNTILVITELYLETSPKKATTSAVISAKLWIFTNKQMVYFTSRCLDCKYVPNNPGPHRGLPGLVFASQNVILLLFWGSCKDNIFIYTRGGVILFRKCQGKCRFSFQPSILDSLLKAKIGWLNMWNRVRLLLGWGEIRHARRPFAD